MRRFLVVLLTFAAACGGLKDVPADGVGQPVGKGIPVDSASPTSAAPGTAAARPDVPDSVRRPPAALVPTPDPVRGLYVNRWVSLSRKKMSELIDVANRTEVNALVLDVKDDRG